MKNKLMELVQLAIEMNKRSSFQITLSLNGYIAYGSVPTFSLSVSQKCDFKNARYFHDKQGASSVDPTDENIEKAKEWLINLHNELIKKAA